MARKRNGGSGSQEDNDWVVVLLGVVLVGWFILAHLDVIWNVAKGIFFLLASIHILSAFFGGKK